MNTVLEYNDLDNICLEFLDKAKLIDWYFYNYLLLLYNTGLRPVEALDKTRAISHNNDNIIFQPSKNNNQRTILITDIPEPFFYYYFSDGLAYNSYKYRNYLRLYKNISSNYNLYVKDKRLELYLFRYNFIYNYHQANSLINDLKLTMGWTTETMANKYINEPIYLM